MKKSPVLRLLALLLFFMLLWAYSGHFNNPFEFDDAHTIMNNGAIRSLKNIPQFFTDASTISVLPANQIYRPGLTTLNAIDYWMGGEREPNPFYYHVSIFISYVILSFLMYFLFLKIFNKTINHQWNEYIALLGAGFFSLHTANAETVNYIIARSDSFSTLMIVISLLTYLYKPEWRNKLIYLIPIVIGFSVKEPTIMIFPILFVYVLLFEKQVTIPELLSKKGLKEFSATFVQLLPLFVLAILLMVVSKKMAAETFSPGSTPRFNYILTQPFVILHYFGNFVLPINLSADTDWLPIANIKDYRVWVGSAFVSLLVLISIYCSAKSRLRPIAFGIIWFILALLPTSLNPLAEVMNDHRTFFPFVGLIIASTWTLALLVFKFEKQIEANKKLSGLTMAIALLLIGGHAYGTKQRCKVWSSPETLWYDVTIKSPKNARGLMNYAVTKMKTAEYDTALSYIEKAKEISPNYSYIYINLAIIKAAQGKHNEVEDYFKKALSLYDGQPNTYYFYADWLKSQKRYTEALEKINNAIRLSENHAQSKRLKEQILLLIYEEKNALAAAELRAKKEPTPANYLNLSLLHYQTGNYEACIEAAKKALELNPNYTKAYNNICSANNALGNYDEAIKAGKKALEIEPNYQLVKNNLLVSIKSKREVDSILTIVRMQPTAVHYSSLSYTYYKLGAYKKCIEAAEKAIKIDPKTHIAYNNICSSYNELKQWDKAIEAGEAGLKVNPNYQLLKNNLEVSRKGKIAGEIK